MEAALLSQGGDDQARFSAHHPAVLQAQTGKKTNSEHTWFAAATAAITGIFEGKAKHHFEALDAAIRAVKDW